MGAAWTLLGISIARPAALRHRQLTVTAASPVYETWHLREPGNEGLSQRLHRSSRPIPPLLANALRDRAPAFHVRGARAGPRALDYLAMTR